MNLPLRTLILATGLMASLNAAHAIEFRSVSKASILYETPSETGKRLFIIATGTPVEVVVVVDKWVKVRDAGGTLNWIEGSALSPRRTLLVSADRATVRQGPEAAAAPVFEAARDTVLELRSEPASGWVQVGHQDGLSGYVRVTEVWGL
nr:hypothetical protein [Zoogloeaceae bacterium]